MERITEIIHDKCEEVLKELPDGSIDLLCTDPPYGVSFMGKHWDKAVPSVEVWKECFRLLKPGSFAFVMSLPRADCLARMIINLESAGFVVAFTPIFWTFASGFPKAMNISKAVDKKLGKKRKVIGKKWIGRASKRVRSQVYSDYGNGAQTDLDITSPSSSEAKKLEGSYAGFQPKPAVEVIIVAMKPFKGNFVDQALQTGKGITWLNDCRIPTQENLDGGSYSKGKKGRYGEWGTMHCFTGKEYEQPEGRFPANLLVSDDILNDGRVIEGKLGMTQHGSGSNKVYGTYNNSPQSYVQNGTPDKGSFSRYFDLDKWFQEKLGKFSKRLHKTYPFLIETKATNKEKWFYCLKCKKVVYAPEKGEHQRHAYFCETCNVHFPPPNLKKHKSHKTRSNFIFHPTVKPLKLMCYLVTMGSRPGNIVLDPFAGTCKTAMAAEVLKRQYIMIEQDEIAVKLGEAGIQAVKESSYGD